MKTSTKFIAAGLFAGIWLTSCTWVELKPQADKVRILSAREVARCKELGRITANTTAKVGFIERGSATVQDEVNRLARNNAADMDGDTLVPASTLIDGEQMFKVYRCINP
jgi:hypothetical protein